MPGALAMEDLTVPMPTEIERKAGTYQGGGETAIWRRWGYVLAPAGYDWVGSEEAFPSDAAYRYVVESGTPKTLSASADPLANVVGTWKRKAASALSLGILPVFHS